MYTENNTGIGVAVSPPNTSGRFDDKDICAIYLNLLVHGWLDPGAMPIRMCTYYGVKLGHYGRLAVAHQEAVEAGVTAIASGFNAR